MQDKHELIQRLSASMTALNVRIARLASALHVPLNDPRAVAALMATQPGPAIIEERRKSSIDLAQVQVSSDRRQALHHEELRGLLVLRYHMATTCLNENGWAVTREAMMQSEEHLLLQGFKPGADGLGIDSFFNVK